MRKQTKVVAVASAAALLAIGGAMTSFAAQGWVEEDGTWYYYDKDGNRVEDEWKKSGDNWFWLDSEEGGAMATDKIIDDNDDTYYVDGNGVMVTNTWVKVVNEDQDDDDPAEYRYYYMQSNGKAYKGSGDKVSKKTIDGKQYAFDEDGIMLYGWVDEDGTMVNDEDGWADATYYFGSWEDGSMKTGWQKITVHDSDNDKDDDYDYWFNFKANGKKCVQLDNGSEDTDATWKNNGKYYHFDTRGVMVYEWYPTQNTTSNLHSASNWSYFNSPEDGAKVVKGWFKVVGPNEDTSFKELDSESFASVDGVKNEDARWYYNDGREEGLVAGKIKKIKGKYYGFRPDDGEKGGAMLKGLCALEMDGENIVKVYDDDMDADDLDDFLDGVDAGHGGAGAGQEYQHAEPDRGSHRHKMENPQTDKGNQKIPDNHHRILCLLPENGQKIAFRQHNANDDQGHGRHHGAYVAHNRLHRGRPMQVKHQHSQQNEGGDGRHGEYRLDADSVPGEQRSLHQEKDHIKGNQRRTVVEHGNLSKEGYAQGEPQKGQVGKGDQAGHAYAELPLRVKHPAHRHAQNQGAADDGEPWQWQGFGSRQPPPAYWRRTKW